MGLWDGIIKIKDVIKNAINEEVEAKRIAYDKWYSYYQRREKDELKRDYYRFKSGELSMSYDHGSRFAALISLCRENGYIDE